MIYEDDKYEYLDLDHDFSCSVIPPNFAKENDVYVCGNCQSFQDRRANLHGNANSYPQECGKLACTHRPQEAPPIRIKLKWSRSDNSTTPSHDTPVARAPERKKRSTAPVDYTTIDLTNLDEEHEDDTIMDTTMTEEDDTSGEMETSATHLSVTAAEENTVWTGKFTPARPRPQSNRIAGADAGTGTDSIHTQEEDTVIPPSVSPATDETNQWQGKITPLDKSDSMQITVKLPATTQYAANQVKNLERSMEEVRKQETGSRYNKRGKVDIKTLLKAMETFLAVILYGRHMLTKMKVLIDIPFELVTNACSNSRYGRNAKKAAVHLEKRVKAFMRKTVYVPWHILRKIDLNVGGGMNYSVVNHFRDLESPSPYERCAMPEKSQIQHEARALEEHAEKFFPLEFRDTEHGPLYYFGHEELLRVLLDRYNVEKFVIVGGEGGRPLQLCYTLDALQLTPHLTVLIAGLKWVDGRATNPLTGLPLFLDSKRQSRDHCIPFAIFFGKDNKDVYDQVMRDPFFDFFNKIRTEGLPANPDKNWPAIDPARIQLLSPQDLSSIWKSTGKGGGSYQTILFCYLCMCHRDERANCKRGDDRCDLCKTRERERCFCHKECDCQYIQSCKDDLAAQLLEDVQAHYERLDGIRNESSLRLDSNQPGRQDDKSHIDYVLPPEDDDKFFEALLAYDAFLVEELALRLPVSQIRGLSGVEAKRAKLREQASAEARILHIRDVLLREDNAAELAQILAEEGIPCILHLENRVSEKLFSTLLSMGIDRYAESQNATQKCKVFVSAVTEVMNSAVLVQIGGAKAQWTFPLDSKTKKTVEKKSLVNVRAQKCASGLEALANAIFDATLDENDTPDCRTRNEKAEKDWTDVADAWIDFIEMARQEEASREQRELTAVLWNDQ